MNKYSWLFFDLDNTLLDFGASSKSAFMYVFKELGHELGDDHYAIYQEVNHQVWSELEKGLISSKELKSKRWRMFMEKMDWKYSPKEINSNYFEKLKTNPIFIKGAKELIDETATALSEKIAFTSSANLSMVELLSPNSWPCFRANWHPLLIISALVSLSTGTKNCS